MAMKQAKSKILELINDRIRQLFGDVGGELGQFYYDSYYQVIFRVVNNAGGVSRVLQVSTPQKTLDILDTILMYELYRKNEYKRV